LKGVLNYIWAQWDDFRTLGWIDAIKYPEIMLKQVDLLLNAKMSY